MRRKMYYALIAISRYDKIILLMMARQLGNRIGLP